MSAKRILYFDILNIISCLGVLFQHHNDFIQWRSVYTLSFKLSLLAHELFYWAVPVFFMLTGATLMGYRTRYSTLEFFKHRIQKAFIPFIVWNILIIIGDVWIAKNIPWGGIRQAVNWILNNNLNSSYWFFIPLFSLYATLPVFSLLKDNRAVLWYSVIMTFLFTTLFPLVSLLGIRYNNFLRFPLTGTLGIYLLLGYLLSTTSIKKCQRFFLYIAGILCAFLRIFGELYITNKQGHWTYFFWDYTKFYCVIMGAAVFVFINEAVSSYINENTTKYSRIEKVCAFLSSCSFGIYLIHKPLMYQLLKIIGTTTENIYWCLLGPFMTYFISLLIVVTLRKIPVVKKIVP